MNDSERIDWLEKAIRDVPLGGYAVVVISAWYSKPGDTPDGWAVNVGELHPGLEEEPTLRDAIDAAAAE